MNWLRLTVETNETWADVVADFLEQFGASAISYSAASDEKIFAEPGEDSSTLWQRTEVSGLLPEDVDMDILLVCLKDRVGADGLFARRIDSIADQDWVDAYKNSQQALTFNNRLCICPSWITPPQTTLPAIILDPGLAFGTGTHATTALCLQWLATSVIEGKSVFDFGCGSGILALAAARLGASQVYAVDIDPLAVTASEQNARQNDLQHQLVIGMPDTLDVPPVDLLLANVLLNPLLNHAEQLARQVKAQGRIVLSGILANQTDTCSAAYEPWFVMDAPRFQDEWAMLSGVRR